MCETVFKWSARSLTVKCTKKSCIEENWFEDKACVFHTVTNNTYPGKTDRTGERQRTENRARERKVRGCVRTTKRVGLELSWVEVSCSIAGVVFLERGICCFTMNTTPAGVDGLVQEAVLCECDGKPERKTVTTDYTSNWRL